MHRLAIMKTLSNVYRVYDTVTGKSIKWFTTIDECNKYIKSINPHYTI